jgi:predicted ArsR family transcriptional regulator
MADMKPVQVLAERHGGASPELKERLKQQRAAHKEILRALRDGPRTVAQVADATALPKHEVLWHLMALKKYGEVVEAEEQEDCYTYARSGGEV